MKILASYLIAIVTAIAPIFLFEVGVALFYLFNIGTIPWDELHHIAWAMDITWLLYAISTTLLLVGLVETTEKNLKFVKPKHKKNEKVNSHLHRNDNDHFLQKGKGSGPSYDSNKYPGNNEFL